VDATDVLHVVLLAREAGLELAVRSGGHSLAGHSVSEGGIVLDLSDMRVLDIDAEHRAAWAQTGLTAGEYTAAAGTHGLATGFGDTGSVGIGTWNETFLVPAAVAEGVGGLALGATLVSLGAGTIWSRRLAWWALWYCFAGVLWGMVRQALGSIPAAHTVSNDFLHIAMTLVTTLALVRLASLRD